jgi:hypothetical protein
VGQPNDMSDPLRTSNGKKGLAIFHQSLNSLQATCRCSFPDRRYRHSTNKSVESAFSSWRVDAELIEACFKRQTPLFVPKRPVAGVTSFESKKQLMLVL